jgi:hypothetical protein
MGFEFDGKLDQHPASDSADTLLAGCFTGGNPLMCNYGASSHTTNEIDRLQRSERLPDQNEIITQGAVVPNPYSLATDSMSTGINQQEHVLMKETIRKGNTEIDNMKHVAAGANKAAVYTRYYAYATTLAAASGEMYMSYGSRLPQTQEQLKSEVQVPYVLNKLDYYDLGGIALGDLYSARAALQGFERSMVAKQQGFSSEALDGVKQRLSWDVDKIVGRHNIPAIFNDLSGPIYQQYSDRFDAWREQIKAKINNTDPNHPVIYFDDNVLFDPQWKSMYQAKLKRDLALVDMVMLRNGAGNHDKLAAEITDSLESAKDLDPDSADLRQLQKSGM